MGKPVPPPPSYRDDPEAVSLHTTPDDYAYTDLPEPSGLPPSYSDSEASNHVPASAIPIRHVAPPSTRTNHDRPSFKYGKPCVVETVDVMEPAYDTDPAQLEEAIRAYANSAPVPLIYIMGTHKETVRKNDNKKETHHVTDFRIVINLQYYLHPNFNPSDTSPMSLVTVSNGEKTHRGTILAHRAPGVNHDIEIGSSPPPSLTEWCHRYCASPRMLRIFRLRRQITGLEETQLRNRITGLLRSTDYRGNISITFPIEEANIDIYTSNRINTLRLKTWVCWLFYLSFLWIFSWPVLFFATRRYAVVRAEWPFSTTDERGEKRYTTVSEEQWFDMWKVGIRRLALERFQGEATEDMMRRVMARDEDPSMPGSLTGHAGVDGALSVLSEGVRVARAVQGGRGMDLSFAVGRSVQGGGWGYDC
ncbi:hypothetical protein COCVIDRAFT_15639 [Bipolaris victoriae FI3]|uniref:Uncharacterized protein n=1 Tax=Bipolaris victoriae (strain FI3) TaxID=930091 RepID=W7EGS2_BIPV3|nr:hypothetical protein COCVIDRAFT_15639 [Bipolaris victoriae FI3]